MANTAYMDSPQKKGKLIDSSGRWIAHVEVFPASVLGSVIESTQGSSIETSDTHEAAGRVIDGNRRGAQIGMQPSQRTPITL